VTSRSRAAHTCAAQASSAACGDAERLDGPGPRNFHFWSRAAPETDDAAEAGKKFAEHVDLIQRSHKLTRSAAIDRAMREPNVRELYDRSNAASQAANRPV
jgi:hypothetical protein